MTPSKAITLKLHAIKYFIVDGKLYWKDPLGFLLCFLTESETEGFIDEFHEGICKGHHAWRETAYKILRAVLASEVTPGLLAGAEPDTHQFYVTIAFNG
jgi:hypothetical protein